MIRRTIILTSAFILLASAPNAWGQACRVEMGCTGASNVGTSATILIGQGTTFEEKAVSGDCTILATGAITCSGADTNAKTLCADGEVLFGEAVTRCESFPTCTGTDKLFFDGSNFSCASDADTNTNAGTICANDEYLNGDTTCDALGGDVSGSLSAVVVANDSHTHVQANISDAPITVANGGRECGAIGTIAALPGVPVAGMLCSVNNGSTTAGDCSTTGSDKFYCWYDGAAWSPIASGFGDLLKSGTWADNEVIRTDGTAKDLQGSGCTLTDAGALTCNSTITASCTPASSDCGMITDDNTADHAAPGAGKMVWYSKGNDPFIRADAAGAAEQVCTDADITGCVTSGDFFNGTVVETMSTSIAESGGTVTLSLEGEGSVDLTVNTSLGQVTLDTTPAATIALTVGSDASPQENYIYILESTGALTKSTSDWPTAEHARVGFYFVPSATFVAATGVYINQTWNDHAKDSNDQGHLAHMTERLRYLHAIYHSGVDGAGDGGTYITRTAASPDTVYIEHGAGVVMQMHRHATAAYDSAVTPFLIPNSSVAAYEAGNDLYDFLVDSTGASMSGKFYNLVIWASANKTGEYEPLMVNLPDCSYNSLSDAQGDVSGCDVFTIPASFDKESTTGYLIARLTMKHAVGGGGDLELQSTVDLRGQTPASVTGGSAAGAVVNFADNQFTIFDESDTTKIIAFQASGITTATTRTLTSPDASGILALTSQTDGTITEADITDLNGITAIDFLVGTASGVTSAEIVAGTSPGGELGGTWGTPTVDATHSGSAHHTATVDTGPSPDCSGTTTYQDGEANCDTLDGLEDFETATDDALVVGNGTTFDSKVLTDCDGASDAMTYDVTTNVFGCNTIAGGSGAFSDAADPVVLNTTTKGVDIGPTALGAKLGISGDADEVQLHIVEHSVQTATDLVRIEETDGTDIYRLFDSGTNQYEVIYRVDGTPGMSIASAGTTIFTAETAAGTDMLRVQQTGEVDITTGPLDVDGTSSFAGQATFNATNAPVSIDGTTCLDVSSDQIFHDTNCDGTKDAGEEFIDQAGGAAAATLSWSNGPVGNNNSNEDATDTCTCNLYFFPGAMADLDVFGFATTTASAAEVLELGVYSLDGATQYFECDASTGIDSTGVKTCSNDTASPATMGPEDIWICQGNSGTGSQLRGHHGTGQSGRYCHFTQACSGGEMPATLTTPACTWGAQQPMLASLSDE